MNKCYVWGVIMLISKPRKKVFPFCIRVPNYKIDSDIFAIEAGYNCVPPGLCQIFKRDVFILHYIVRGKGVFLDCNFDESNGYFVVPNELEIIKSDKENPYESYWIMFKGDGASELLEKLNLKHNCVFSVDNKQDCINCIKEVLFKNDYLNEAEEAYALQSALYKIISIHMKSVEIDEVNTPSVSAVIANTIKRNYCTPMKIAELAKDLNISRNYMYTIFKKDYGISPQEYLIRRRIEKSKQLLINNGARLSIKEISNAVGFENPLYFSRLFHARTGVSPSQYRKMTKELSE